MTSSYKFVEVQDCDEKGRTMLEHGAKAFEKGRFRPMYAGANMGHPSRRQDNRPWLAGEIRLPGSAALSSMESTNYKEEVYHE
jgi:hypothetical protein